MGLQPLWHVVGVFLWLDGLPGWVVCGLRGAGSSGLVQSNLVSKPQPFLINKKTKLEGTPPIVGVLGLGVHGQLDWLGQSVREFPLPHKLGLDLEFTV